MRGSPDGQITFPNPHNFPASLSEHADDQLVPRYVLIELGKPEIQATLWGIREFAAFMPMPETPVDENRDPVFCENEIGFAKHSRITSPARYSLLSKQRDQTQFGSMIAG
jgi:hypothetical protein